jgi:hypothetical protein
MKKRKRKRDQLLHRFESGDGARRGAAVGSTQEQAEDHGGTGSHAELGVINRGAQRLIRIFRVGLCSPGTAETVGVWKDATSELALLEKSNGKT